ncbi:methyltransferase domain-containing protein [Mycobacterium sp. 1274756.6]|uniref:class I SAM-dependent methyltransferase n=1 Tax=Mycobacterium sp. 1274756.6 TaxID=1834076 RepID=UPI0007FDB19B|nr:methyltransferase domain-containing protein [Mycobacterium sp. 1274756.6]OBJ72170.1 ubiquinone biosynthesis protein [Mycobacterium sp. 1274756.6]
MSSQRTRWGQQTLFDRANVAAYSYGVENAWIARPFGRLVWGTDVTMFYDAIADLGGLPDGAAVLDIPCGSGVALRGLRPAQRLRYVAADISPDMLSRARRRAAELGDLDIEFAIADIEALPFGDNEFDVVVSFNGLHCLPDPATAVAELARCLKPGGRLVALAVVRGAGWRHDLAIEALRRAGVFGPGGTAAELRRWLTDAGLTVDTLRCSGALAHVTAHR